MIKIFIFLILIDLSFQNLSLNIRKASANYITIPVCLGIPRQCTDLVLSLVECDVVLFRSKDYFPDISETKSLILSIGADKVLYSDHLYFNDNLTINDLYITSGKNITKQGYLGLNRKRFEDFTLTVLFRAPLIDRLYSKSGNKKIFYIDLNDLQLVIGDYPEVYFKKYSQENKKIAKHCNRINDRTSYYNCKGEMIYFTKANGNYAHHLVDSIITFDIGVNGIFVPKHFFDFLVNAYFFKQIQDQKCMVTGWSDFHFVKCEEEYNYLKDPSLHPISIVIGKFTLKLEPKYLFSGFISKSNYFLMLYNENKKPWTFGYPLFEKYTIVFDDEKDIITFLNEKN